MDVKLDYSITVDEFLEIVESVCWLSIDEINSLMNEDKFFKNHYEEFEILLNWLKEGEKTCYTK